MTEADWQFGNDIKAMLRALEGKSGDRKLILFSAACCRRIWHLLPDERSRKAVEVAESFAEGRIGTEALTDVTAGADAPWQEAMAAADSAEHAALAAGHIIKYDSPEYQTARRLAWAAYAPKFFTPDAFETADSVSMYARHAAGDISPMAFFSVDPAANPEREAQKVLLNEIFGDPFLFVTLDPAWLTPVVLELARTIHEERAFDRLSELAEALEAAGCGDTDILRHCRGPGPHVRGCSVIDALLGKP